MFLKTNVEFFLFLSVFLLHLSLKTHFEKVDLLVSGPDERGVDVVGDSLEAAGDLLRVAVVHLLIRETPVAIS